MARARNARAFLLIETKALARPASNEARRARFATRLKCDRTGTWKGHQIVCRVFDRYKIGSFRRLPNRQFLPVAGAGPDDVMVVACASDLHSGDAIEFCDLSYRVRPNKVIKGGSAYLHCSPCGHAVFSEYQICGFSKVADFFVSETRVQTDLVDN